jgi:hypothetical protein
MNKDVNIDFSDFGIDDEFVSRHSPKPSSNSDPFQDHKESIQLFIAFLASDAPARTMITRKLDDGRSFQLYKDKNSIVWYNWKPSNGKYTRQIRVR